MATRNPLDQPPHNVRSAYPVTFSFDALPGTVDHNNHAVESFHTTRLQDALLGHILNSLKSFGSGKVLVTAKAEKEGPIHLAEQFEQHGLLESLVQLTPTDPEHA